MTGIAIGVGLSSVIIGKGGRGASGAASNFARLFALIRNPGPALYELNPASPLNIRRIGSASNFGISENNPQGIAWNPRSDTLYFTGQATDILSSLSVDNGVAATTITNKFSTASNQVETRPDALAFSQNSEILFLVGQALEKLCIVNRRTGRITFVSDTVNNYGLGKATFVSDMTFDPRSNTLFAINNTDNWLGEFIWRGENAGSLQRIGSATNFGVGQTDMQGIAIDYATNRVFCWGNSPKRFYEINRGTGVCTEVDDFTNVQARSPRDLEFANNILSDTTNAPVNLQGSLTRLLGLSANPNALYEIQPQPIVKDTRLGSATNYDINETKPSALAWRPSNDTAYMTGLDTRRLLRVDNFGEATSAGPVGFVAAASGSIAENNPTAFAYNQNSELLFMTGDDLHHLLQIDQAKGTYQTIGDLINYGFVTEPDITISDMTFDPNTNRLFAINATDNWLGEFHWRGSRAGELVRIGNATNWGANEINMRGIAWDSQTDRLVGSGDDRDALYNIDVNDGTAMILGTFQNIEEPRDLAFQNTQIPVRSFDDSFDNSFQN